MREHLLLSVTKFDNWTNFVREIESSEHATKTIGAPTPMELDAFQGNCHKCGKIRTNCERVSEFERWRSSRASVCAVWKIMDSVGHGATRHPTKIHRKEDGQVTKKETARERRRVASPKKE